MTRVNSGADYQSKAMGGNVAGSLGFSGTAGSAGNAPTATTLTDSGAPAWTVNVWTGCTVICPAAGVYGVVVSNTATVLTVDMWHTAGTPGTVGTTPAASAIYVIGPQAPAWWIGLSVAVRAIVGADTFLTNDGTTVSELWATGGGCNRALATYTHTTGASSYTLTKQFTSNSNDNAGVAFTVNRIGVFQHQVTAAPTTTTSGVMVFSTNLTNTATLVPTAGDQITVTEVVNI